MALGGDVIKQIHTRMVTMAQSHGLTEGRRMRVDTTVVETKSRSRKLLSRMNHL